MDTGGFVRIIRLNPDGNMNSDVSSVDQSVESNAGDHRDHADT